MLKVNGVGAGEPFWYAPLCNYAVPVQMVCNSIVRLPDGNYFIGPDGGRIYPSEVHRTEQEAIDRYAGFLKSRIEKCEEEIENANAILAKLEPAILIEEAPTDDVAIPF